MRIRFIEREDTYSVYTEPDGTEVLIAHGPGMRRVFEYDLDVVQALWDKHRPTLPYGSWGRSQFVEILRDKLTEPDIADDLVWCEHCEKPGTTDDDYTSISSGYVCQSCLENWYSWCERCEEHTHSDYINSTLDDSIVCDSCRDSYYSFCDDCDGYYRDGQGCGANHDDDEDESGGCCESPLTTFSVPNDGNGPLSSDVVTVVTLPSGTITEEGMNEIYRYVRNMSDSGYLYAGIVHEVGATVQLKEGTFTKRLSRALWKKYQYKIAPGDLSQIGNIASAHSRAVEHKITVSRYMNDSAAAWGHSQSCYWQSYYKSRCTLKTNGGFGMRSWADDEQHRVTGRSWVMPLRAIRKPKATVAQIRAWAKSYGFTVADAGPLPSNVLTAYAKRYGRTELVPTFDALNPDAYVVFNGYGNLSDYTPARIMAYMAGMTYRKIGFECRIEGGDNCMYVNAGGYLIAPEELASEYTDSSLVLNLDHHSNLYAEEQRATAAALAALTSEKELVNV